MKGKVQVFWGTDTRCGVTMLAHAVADEMARNQREKNILLLFLSGSAGNDFTHAGFHSGLDDLQLKIKSRVLTSAELESACMKQANLSILKGTEDLLLRRKYEPEDVKFLFQLAGEAFDVILVDAGSSVDLGLCIGALLYGDVRNLVTTQGRQALHRYMQKRDQVLQDPNIKIEFDRLIVNQFYTASYLSSKKELADRYQLTSVCLMEYSGYGWQAENEGRLLIRLDKGYARDVEKLAKRLSGQQEKETNGAARRWPSRFLGTKK